MGRLRIFARVTREGFIECYEDDIRVGCVSIECASKGYVKLNDLWDIYKMDDKTFRVERVFDFLGPHSLILTTTNYSNVPFTVHLPVPVLFVCFIFLIIPFPMLWYSHGDKISCFVTALTIFAGIVVIVSGYIVRRQRKAIVSFFTFPSIKEIYCSF